MIHLHVRLSVVEVYLRIVRSLCVQHLIQQSEPAAVEGLLHLSDQCLIRLWFMLRLWLAAIR